MKKRKGCLKQNKTMEFKPKRYNQAVGEIKDTLLKIDEQEMLNNFG